MDKFRLGVVFSPFCDQGNIDIRHNVNFTVKLYIIKTVRAFLIMLPEY